MFILEFGEVEVVDEKTFDVEGVLKLLCKFGLSFYFGEFGLLNFEIRVVIVCVLY